MSYFIKRHSLVLPASERWEYPEDAYFRLDFASRHISSSLCVIDPLPMGLNGDGKNVQTLWWVELDRLHSMTCAHPPLHQNAANCMTIRFRYIAQPRGVRKTYCARSRNDVRPLTSRSNAMHMPSKKTMESLEDVCRCRNCSKARSHVSR